MIARIDRDTTRRKGAMEGLLKSAESGEQQILLGTQLLAKGHHFPKLTLVAILDSDQGLFSADFRSAERMAQLILQVAGRAGRGIQSGEVLIQTHHPEHELMQAVVKQDYSQITEALLAERKLLHWPPYSYLAMIRAESSKQPLAMEFLLQLSAQSREKMVSDQVTLLGPVPAPMEKRAGRFRAQLLLQTNDRALLHQQLTVCLQVISTLPEARQVRWSVDVDPQEMF
jgi:primosomal protein N' (replication factor Y)